MHAKILYVTQDTLLCKIQSVNVSVIYKFDRLKTSHIQRQKSYMSIGKVIGFPSIWLHNMWSDLPKADIMTHFGNPDYYIPKALFCSNTNAVL